jgi:hypothetical protein
MKGSKVLVLIFLLYVYFIPAQGSAPIPIEKNGSWGFVDNNGNIVISCIYENVDSFKDGIAFVYNNCRTVHPNGEDVANPQFRDCKQGAVNIQGKLVIPIEYDFIGDFNENGIAIAFRDGLGFHYYDRYTYGGKLGFIDKMGKAITPFYKEGILLRPGNDFSILSLDGKVGLLNKRENRIIVPVFYDEIKSTNKYYDYRDIPAWETIKIRLGKKWGFYNPLNDMLVEPQFDDFFRSPKYQIDETEQFVFTKTNDEIWLWNKITGKKVFFGKYNDLHLLKTDNLLQYFQ